MISDVFLVKFGSLSRFMGWRMNLSRWTSNTNLIPFPFSCLLPHDCFFIPPLTCHRITYKPSCLGEWLVPWMDQVKCFCVLRRSRYFSAWAHFCLSMVMALVYLLNASRQLHVQWLIQSFSSALLVRPIKWRQNKEWTWVWDLAWKATLNTIFFLDLSFLGIVSFLCFTSGFLVA